MKIDLDKALFYSNHGSEYASNGEYDKAINALSSAIKHNPKDSNLYVVRGHIFSDKGECDKAITDYNQAIMLESDNSEAFYLRGKEYIKKGEADIEESGLK